MVDSASVGVKRKSSYERVRRARREGIVGAMGSGISTFGAVAWEILRWMFEEVEVGMVVGDCGWFAREVLTEIDRQGRSYTVRYLAAPDGCRTSGRPPIRSYRAVCTVGVRVREEVTCPAVVEWGVLRKELKGV